MANDFVEARLESTAFSCEHVQIHKLAGREAISQLFAFDLEVVSTASDEPTAADMAGAEVAIMFHRGGEERRRIHGMVAEVNEMFETEVPHRSYRLRVVPRAFRLTLVELQDIYMDLSVPEIIQHKLELLGFTEDDLELRLLESYPKLELVMQYKETDITFVSRITEHLGISFFFEHTSGIDKIVFTDGHGFPFVPGREAIAFRARGESRDVFSIEGKTSLIPKSYVLQDYNYRTPRLDLTSICESAVGYGGGVVELGAHFKTPDDGAKLAKIRAEEREARRFVFTAKSDACEIGAGNRFTLTHHARLDGTELLVTEIEHALTQPVLIHGGTEDAHYENTFRAIDAALAYRPPRITPKPRIHGVMTGIIEQEPDAEFGNYARIDEQGRYTVKFIFDTAPPGQRKASRPVRMIQAHTGPDYGIHFPLKPGAEVLLTFIDGDPDRPLIVGAAPNPATPSPVTRGNSLENVIKTASGILVTMKDS